MIPVPAQGLTFRSRNPTSSSARRRCASLATSHAPESLHFLHRPLKDRLLSHPTDPPSPADAAPPPSLGKPGDPLPLWTLP